MLKELFQLRCMSLKSHNDYFCNENLHFWAQFGGWLITKSVKLTAWRAFLMRRFSKRKHALAARTIINKMVSSQLLGCVSHWYGLWAPSHAMIWQVLSPGQFAHRAAIIILQLALVSLCIYDHPLKIRCREDFSLTLQAVRCIPGGDIQEITYYPYIYLAGLQV